MPDLERRTWLNVDLDAIVSNYHEITGKLGETCRMIAVVKADAYGLGAVPIARELEKEGCDYFAVSCLEEALELRRAGIRSRILVLGPVSEEETAEVLNSRVEVPVVSLAQGEMLSRRAGEAGCRLPCHIALDAGLSRFGIVLEDRRESAAQETVLRESAAQEVAEILKLPGLDVRCFFTHFTGADPGEYDQFNRRQMEKFGEFTDQFCLDGGGIKRHCSSSGIVEHYPEYNYDYIRVAALVLGLYNPLSSKLYSLLHSCELKTRILQIKTIPAGAPVSYGPTFYTDKETKIGIVPVGFADGLRRSLSNVGTMTVRGKEAPIIGKVCMDFTILDLTAVEDAQEGDEVTVFGKAPLAHNTVNTVAALYPGSVGEVTTALNRRIPRIYYRFGKKI